ncbi:hypothetical protein FRB96_009705 [Tulasnella sp. 330]|nr:hypothetical protein FRB96_009705 [Tulasnella sp. 330]
MDSTVDVKIEMGTLSLQDGGGEGGRSISRDMDVDDNVFTATQVASIPVANPDVLMPGKAHTHHGLRLILSTENSHLVSILSPNRAVTRGGNCDLFKGLYAPGNLILAMKRPRVSQDQAETATRRFKREVKIWTSLIHINILPFFGLVEISSETYLVSPWMDHGDLFTFVKSRLRFLASSLAVQEQVSNEKRSAFLKFDEAASIHGVATGLAYLHRNNVIHGDLKAANVLLGDDLSPLLCDFGIAKNLEFNNTSDGQKGHGTTRWMSPGMTLGEKERTAKTDIYAFGMTIAEVLTGHAPCPDLKYDSQFIVSVIINGQRPKPEPLSRHGKDFRPLWELAASCWQADAEVRPNADQVVHYTMALVRPPVSSSHYMRVEHRVLKVPDDDKPSSRALVETGTGEVGDLLRLNGLPPQCEPCNAIELDCSSLPASDDSSQSPSEAEDEDGSVTTTDTDTVDMDPARFDTWDGRNTEQERCKPRKWDEHRGSRLRAKFRKFKGLGDQREMAGSLYRIGKYRLAKEKYRSAMSSLHDAYMIYKVVGDRYMMAKCAYNFASAGLETKAYMKAHDLFAELGHRWGMAHCLKKVGELWLDIHSYTWGDVEEYAKGVTSLTNAFTIYQELNAQSCMAECTERLADAFRGRGRCDDAIEKYAEAYGLYLGLGDFQGMARCLQSVGDTKTDQKLYAEAISPLSNALAIWEDVKDVNRLLLCTAIIAMAYAEGGRLDRAVAQYEVVYGLFAEWSDSRAMVSCLKMMAEFQKTHKLYRDAASSWVYASAIYKQRDQPKSTATCVKKAADVLKEGEQWDEAMSKYVEAYALFEECGWVDGRDGCMKEFGLLRRRLRPSDSSPSPSDKAALYKELGDYHSKAGRSQDAISSFAKAYALFKEVDERTQMADCLRRIAILQRDLGLYKECSSLFEEAYRLSNQFNDGWEMVECLYRLEATLEKGPAHGFLPVGTGSTDDRRTIVRKAGRMLHDLRTHYHLVPERLRLQVAQLLMREANTCRSLRDFKEAQSVLLEAGRLFERSGEHLEAFDNLKRLEDSLLEAGYVQEALAVSEERPCIQLELP